MRSGVLAVTTLLILGVSSEVRADGVDIVSGGPGGADRAQVQRSLAEVARSLRVCWRGKRPAEVVVTLSVDARGQVTSSRQKTRGRVAQCAAGVLAVQTLAATGKRYTAGVSLATRSTGDRSIHAALKPHRGRLQACRQRASGRASASGRVMLSFGIQPDGRITDPVIKSSAVRDAAIERCLLATLKKTRLDSGLTASPVKYSLSLDFTGTPEAAAPGAGTSTQGAPQPKKDGPLAGAAISAVMKKRMGDFSACYRARARRDPKLAGKVVLRFTIRDDGTVRNVRIRETTMKNSRVEACLVRVGESLRFPAQAGREPTRVWYPFVFSRK